MVRVPAKIYFVGSSLTERIHVGTYSSIKIDQRKARERALATFDENRRAVGMKPLWCDQPETLTQGYYSTRQPVAETE